MYFSHLESHPGKSLIIHLQQVSELALEIIKELQDLCLFLDNPLVAESIKIIGLCHDIGKSTTFFQKYLHEKRYDDQFLKSHSTSSSIYAYYAFRRNFGNSFFSFLIMMIIQGHHGKIPSPGEAVLRLKRHDEKISIQINDFNKNIEFNQFIKNVNIPYFGNYDKIIKSSIELHKMRKTFESSLYDFTRSYSNNILVKNNATSILLKPYFITNLLFSALIDADRANASGIEINKREIINYDTIFNYAAEIKNSAKEKLGDQSKIIQLRDLLLTVVLNNANTEKKILSLTAPTGSGKTLTIFMFANLLRKKIFSRTQRNPRIIYVSPFLSIIDQNAEVISKCLGIDNYKKQSPLMITHHHLAPLVYEDDSSESYSNSMSQLLIEGWNAEVIVTTMVQFLETLIGSRASSLRKLHNIVGSIVILDEVQSIDYKHWQLIHDCLEFLANECGTIIILMTATQPLIFKKDEAFELFDLDKKEKNLLGNDSVLSAERIDLKVDLDGQSVEELVCKIQKIIDDNSNKSILIIMNTIFSSTVVFDSITVNKGEKYYLSSMIVPFERHQRIKLVSEQLNNGDRVILISTQVVEAGVDFDFDILIRDLAPIDSIIQAAGRCNRNGKRSSYDSPVFVYATYDQNQNYFANKIYGNFLIEKTREVLKLGERNLSLLSDIYYDKISESSSQRLSDEILDAMIALNYEIVDEKFKVIENGPTVSVFIEINQESRDVWLKYDKIVNMDQKESSNRLRGFFKANRSIFYSYVINVRESDHRIQSIPKKNGFYYISYDSVGEYYGYTGLQESSNII